MDFKRGGFRGDVLSFLVFPPRKTGGGLATELKAGFKGAGGLRGVFAARLNTGFNVGEPLKGEAQQSGKVNNAIPTTKAVRIIVLPLKYLDMD